MFTEKLLDNKELLSWSIKGHQNGKILPDTFVIDLDTLLENAQKILSEARKNSLKIYYMLKQIGRIPEIGHRLDKMGYDGAVVVDFEEYQRLKKCRIAHIGHLVQVPESLINEVVSRQPEMITVYSIAKAKSISAKAVKLNINANICLRIVDYTKDNIYPGQYSGIDVAEYLKFAKDVSELPNLKIVAITSFPCFLFDKAKGAVVETHNMSTLRDAKKKLKKTLNIDVLINAPSANSAADLKMCAAAGANVVEPGHSLTGTSYEHLYAEKKGQEKIAYLYVTEVSHFGLGRVFAYGGGFYRRSNMENCFIAGKHSPLQKARIKAEDPNAIDYHFEIYDWKEKPEIGDTVISSHRTQMFTTRATVVLVEGLRGPNPRIIGTYTSNGEKIA